MEKAYYKVEWLGSGNKKYSQKFYSEESRETAINFWVEKVEAGFICKLIAL